MEDFVCIFLEICQSISRFAVVYFVGLLFVSCLFGVLISETDKAYSVMGHRLYRIRCCMRLYFPSWYSTGHQWSTLRIDEVMLKLGEENGITFEYLGQHRICKVCRAEVDATSLPPLHALIRLAMQAN